MQGVVKKQSHVENGGLNKYVFGTTYGIIRASAREKVVSSAKTYINITLNLFCTHIITKCAIKRSIYKKYEVSN